MIINYTSSQEHYNNKCFAAGLIWHYLLFLSTKKNLKIAMHYQRFASK
jgi:hypothetical protein